MSDNEVFWEHVHAALDERRDPLADERVQLLVAEDPTRLDELLALRERVANLPASRPRRRLAKVAAVAAVVLVAATAAWFALRNRHEQAATAPPVASESLASRSCVISFQARVVTESADTRSTIDFDGEHVTRSHEFFSESNGDDPTRPQPTFVASIVHLHP